MKRLSVCLLLALLYGCVVPAWAGPVPGALSTSDVAPADVLVAVQLLNQEMDVLRRYMGAPQAQDLKIRVRSVTPHDIYFHALTLFQQVDRLSFEITRRRQLPPKRSMETFQWSDVLSLVATSHQVLDGVMAAFDVVLDHIPVPRVATTQPDDLFLAILKITRQTDLLLRRALTSDDAYRQVTRSIGYLADILMPYFDVVPMPRSPPYEPNKRPADVYKRLVQCMQEVRRVYVALNLPAMDLDTSQVDDQTILSGDVFTLASMVVARLDYLHRHLGVEGALPQAFYPGRKYPSDVYQRAGILLTQLQQLARVMPRRGQAGAGH